MDSNLEVDSRDARRSSHLEIWTIITKRMRETGISIRFYAIYRTPPHGVGPCHPGSFSALERSQL